MVRRYIDFSVGFESAAGGGYLVRAFSDRAEAESVTELPFKPNQLAGVLRPPASDSVPENRVRDLTGPALPATRPDFTELGRALFSALFPGKVGELYASEWSAATEAGHGIRIRLHLRPRNPELAWLTRVPWELIFDERAGGFPCLNPLNPLVRHLDLPRPVERVPFHLPLRILIVASNPSTLANLDLDGEKERIRAAKRVNVEVLEGVGPEDLRRELTRGKYQIVHFMGHGLADSGDGSLVFSAPGGRLRLVTGKEMSHLIQGVPGVRLILLNACHSAAAPKGEGGDPLAGVAGALVRGGQPAVVGMHFPITDRAALTFSEALYERLAEGDPIEAAVSEARLAVYLANSSSTDWVAPVLFLRGADGRLDGDKLNKKQTKENVPQADFNSEEFIGDKATFVGVMNEGCPNSLSPGKVSARIRKVTVGDLTVAGSYNRSSDRRT